MYVDRVPPHDDAAEEAVLGSILVDGNSILQVSTFLRPEDFYRERNRWTYVSSVFLSVNRWKRCKKART